MNTFNRIDTAEEKANEGDHHDVNELQTASEQGDAMDRLPDEEHKDMEQDNFFDSESWTGGFVSDQVEAEKDEGSQSPEIYPRNTSEDEMTATNLGSAPGQQFSHMYVSPSGLDSEDFGDAELNDYNEGRSDGVEVGRQIGTRDVMNAALCGRLCQATRNMFASSAVPDGSHFMVGRGEVLIMECGNVLGGGVIARNVDGHLGQFLWTDLEVFSTSMTPRGN
ncbi:MAG: hypothetical protein M1812_007602 [Candelaria pacifica]|nr:MAG: hypothetical protein M1812_007602 [Candelaria pacifica]